ncbi:MAG: histidine phosphatase family protein [Candidatus Omnitrophota bacterium]
MARLILIRHGETDFNLQKRYCGISDPGLNDTGIRQVKLLDRQLENYTVDKVYCSDRKRTVQTAEIVFRRTIVEKRSDLCEMNFGVFEGMKYEELIKKYGRIYENWIDNPIENEIPNGERFVDFEARIEGALTDILSQHSGKSKNIAIVTHEGPIRVMAGFRMFSRRKKSCFLSFPREVPEGGKRESILNFFWQIKQPLGSFRVVNYE